MIRTIDTIIVELAAVQAQYASYQDGLNEGGDGYNPHTEALRQLQAEYDTACEAETQRRYHARLAAEDAEWTREVTQARRAAWNAWVRAQGHAIHPAQLAAHCQEIGYDMLLLQRQIKRHQL